MTIKNSEILDEFKQAQAQGGGSQLGGGPTAADEDAAGGSSGAGGYGNAQDHANLPGQTEDHQKPVTRELSRGDRFDMEQGGGRADDAVDFGDDLQADERERESLGQRFIDDQGAATEGQQP